jgi:protein-disulfide isomerase
MVTRAMVLAMVGAGCATGDHHLETKVENMATQLEKLQREVAELKAQNAARQVASKPEAATLDQRLDELQHKVDRISQNAARPPLVPRAEPDRSKVYAIPIDGYPSQGPADAKVTMVAARDYACPYSERSRSTLADLRKKYGNDLRIVYRNLVVHPSTATAAALASCAAAKQGKFEVLDAALWDDGFKARRFDVLNAAPSPQCWTTLEGCANAIAFARDAHLDLVRFEADMRTCEAYVQADMRQLATFGVKATPSFFVNGRYLSGAMPLESFELLIDDALATASARISAGGSKATYYRTWILGQGLTKVDGAN